MDQLKQLSPSEKNRPVESRWHVVTSPVFRVECFLFYFLGILSSVSLVIVHFFRAILDIAHALVELVLADRVPPVDVGWVFHQILNLFDFKDDSHV